MGTREDTIISAYAPKLPAHLSFLSRMHSGRQGAWEREESFAICIRPTPLVPCQGGGNGFKFCNLYSTHPLVPLQGGGNGFKFCNLYSTHPLSPPSRRGEMVSSFAICIRPTPLVPLQGGGNGFKFCNLYSTHPLSPPPRRGKFLIAPQGLTVDTKFAALLSAIAKSVPSTKLSPVRSVTT